MRAKNLLAGLIAIFILLPVAKYIALHSNVMDLGLFERHIKALADGEWQVALSGHLQGYSLLLAPFLSGYLGNGVPVGISLVVLQSLLLALSAVILFRVAGVWVALAYMAYTPVWINAHFDFHYDHLVIPLMLGFYLNLINNRIWLAALFAGLLVFVKEPFALETAACGLLMILKAVQSRSAVRTDISPQMQEHPSNNSALKSQLYLAGIALIVGGAGYFYFATRYALPYFAPANWGVFDTNSAFSWLGSGLGEIISNIIIHPLAIVKEVLTTPGKQIYLFVVFGLLAFIPLLAPSYLIPAIPLLAISMLSRLPNYYDYNTHYTAGLIIPVMFAFMHGLPKAHALWMKGTEWVRRKMSAFHLQLFPPAVGGKKSLLIRDSKLSSAFYILVGLWIIGGHVMLSPSPVSRLFWSDKVWSYSWRAYVPTERDAMMKAAMLKTIPADPLIAVSSQNSVNWQHLANRKVYMPFPMGVSEPIVVMDWSNRNWDGFLDFVHSGKIQPAITHNKYADYVVLDLKRPYFVGDKGCDWVYGECKNKRLEEAFMNAVAVTKTSFETVFEQDGFMILKRRSE